MPTPLCVPRGLCFKHLPQPSPLLAALLCLAVTLPAMQVSYLVAPGARLAVGSPDTGLTCNFQEGGSSAMAEMLMKVGQAGYVRVEGVGCVLRSSLVLLPLML